MKKLSCALLLLGLSSLAAARIKIEVFSNPQQLGQRAASAFIEEVESARGSNKIPTFILPTGSTPLPMYQAIIETWKRDKLNFSTVRTFNMDEYVGLAATDPMSYRFFMEQNFFSFFGGHPEGILPHHRYLFANSLSLSAAEKAASEYRHLLEASINNPASQLVLFGGIGRGPAHIAFNDFPFEFSQAPMEKRDALAMQSTSRVVPLDPATRQANARFFADDLNKVPSHAMTIGFKEVLASKRIIIMATDASKKESIANTFAKSPSYEVPSSLLRLSTSSEIEFMVTQDAYSPLSLPEVTVYGLASALSTGDKASLLTSPDSSKGLLPLHKIAMHTGEQVLFVDDGATELFQALQEHAPQANFQHMDFAAWDGTVADHITLLIHPRRSALKASSSQALELVYDTPASRLSDYNWGLLLEAQAMSQMQAAIGQHYSQLQRTPFDQIALAKASESLEDLRQLHKQAWPQMAGAQLFRRGTLIKSQWQAESAFTLGTDVEFLRASKVIVMAPHPDDAEVGAGALILKSVGVGADLEVWNASSGDHSRIMAADLLPYLPATSPLKTKVAQAVTNSEGFIIEPSLVAEIRAWETSQALHILNGAAHVHMLSLPFYHRPSYELGEDDRQAVWQRMQKVLQTSNGRKLTFVLPDPRDAHKCHRASSEVFWQQLLRLSHMSSTPIQVIFYQTPWTGDANLYLYGKGGSMAQGMIAAERLLTAGSFGSRLIEALAVPTAWPLTLLRR